MEIELGGPSEAGQGSAGAELRGANLNGTRRIAARLNILAAIQNE